jgi:hypothetical protein
VVMSMSELRTRWWVMHGAKARTPFLTCPIPCFIWKSCWTAVMLQARAVTAKGPLAEVCMVGQVSSLQRLVGSVDAWCM